MNFSDLPTSNDGASAYLDIWCETYAKRTFQNELALLSVRDRLYAQLYNHL